MAVGAIVLESIHKLRQPVAVDGSAIAWTAAVGILVNGLTTFLLMRYRKSDINSRGAFLHMAADTLVSVGVVVSGVVISLTGWSVIDPIIGILIALIILVSTWDLLSESLRMSLDAVPEGIDPDDVRKKMEDTPGVSSVHHIHIWPISTTEIALTAHLVLEQDARSEDVVRAVKRTLREAGIHHATLETEQVGQACADTSCPASGSMPS